MALKCSSCGASVSAHDEACSYCGTSNPEYRLPDNDINVLLEKAMTAFESGQYAACINYYTQAIAIDPDLFNAYFYLAASYSSLKRPEEAIKAMEKARALRPGNAPIYYNLGILYKEAGRKSEARPCFEKAFELVTKGSATENKDFKQRIEKELAEYQRWKLFG